MPGSHDHCLAERLIMKLINRFFENALYWSTKTTMAVGAVVTILVAIIGTIDVITTRIISHPIPGAFKLSEAGLVLIVFLGFAEVTRSDTHIKVDIIVNRFGPRFKKFSQIIAAILMVGFFSLLATRMWTLAEKSWEIRESATGLLPFPIYPIKISAVLGLCIAAGEAFRFLIRLIIRTSLEGEE
jgi:TRAP-type C4-dicarboxylate transport system permease small subunit